VLFVRLPLCQPVTGKEIEMPGVTHSEQRKLSVLILVVAYQAESTLADVLKRIPATLNQLDMEVLVLDDSSSDRTFEVGLRSTVGSRLRITVLYNPTNQGYGGN
jgi:GT2 family glycosyltransferase